MNLPKDYQSKMQEMLGEEYLQYLDSFNYSYCNNRCTYFNLQWISSIKK